jgi:hypothetical protein
MVITIQPGVTEMLRSERGETPVLLVRGEPGGTLATALRAAAPDIEELAPERFPAEVDDLIQVPGGYLLLAVLGATTPPSARATVAGLLAQRMEHLLAPHRARHHGSAIPASPASRSPGQPD